MIAIAPEWLGVDEFKNGNFWDSNLFIEETKEIYKLIGFKKYNPISGNNYNINIYILYNIY